MSEKVKMPMMLQPSIIFNESWLLDFNRQMNPNSSDENITSLCVDAQEDVLLHKQTVQEVDERN